LLSKTTSVRLKLSICSIHLNSGEEYVVSEIVGRPVLSKRYVEKVLSVIPKYYRRPDDLNLLVRSTSILYSDQKPGAEKII
jgi:hypothetical protein